MTGDPGFQVRTEVRNAIYRLVKDAGGEMVLRMPSGMQEPEPLAGISAAVALERAARRACLEHIRAAREDGKTWEQIADALTLTADPGTGMPAADRAYDYAMPDYRGISPDWFTWSCGCGQLIRDYGPGLDPREGEKGHAEGCARFAAAVAAWDAQWAEGGTDA